MKFYTELCDKVGIYYSVYHTVCDGRHLYHVRTSSNTCVARVSYQEGDKSVSSWVAEKKRRRHIASALYDIIEEHQNIELQPSKRLTPDGIEFWSKRSLDK